MIFGLRLKSIDFAISYDEASADPGWRLPSIIEA